MTDLSGDGGFSFSTTAVCLRRQQLMSMSHKVLGRRASDWLMKKTVYGQFVAGETTEEIKEAVSGLEKVNVGPLLAAPMEDDVHSGHP